MERPEYFVNILLEEHRRAKAFPQTLKPSVNQITVKRQISVYTQAVAMPSLEPKDSQFEPALLLALIVMVGIALGKDVFYDIMAQATAMTGLAILVFALVLSLIHI